MGYTHYWYREKEIDKAKMRAIAEDFSKIVLTLDGMGVRIADGHGQGVPDIGEDLICFNGLEKCGHPPNSEISIPWPSPTAQGVTDAKGQRAGTWFAGAVLEARCCDGDCSYETVYFPRVMPKDYFFQPHEKDKTLFFTCCKTAYRPYDLTVNAFLVIVKHHLTDRVRVSSDGELQHWAEGIELCRVYLGYEETFNFDSDGYLEPVKIAA